MIVTLTHAYFVPNSALRPMAELPTIDQLVEAAA